MTCAKRMVMATLTTVSGWQYTGINHCDKTQKVCPRTEGEGYKKCRDVCHQKSHAEVSAIYDCLLNGSDPTGGHMVINHQPCSECRAHMMAWEITWEIK